MMTCESTQFGHDTPSAGPEKTKQKSGSSTGPSEGNPSSDWLRQGTCLAHSSGMDGLVCNSEHAE